jgi:hypothetical protein
MRSVVIKNPERTKNVSNEKNPPGMKDNPPW